MKVPMTTPYFDDKEYAAVKKVMDSGWLIQGSMVEELERQYCKVTGAKYAVACGNCTEALHMATIALGTKKGDKVLVPAYTFVATANAVEYTGATPIFMDIDLRTFNVSWKDAERALQKCGSAKAIIPVHLFGLCAEMPEILAGAKRLGMGVIEDAACALGSTCPSGTAGAMGLGCFSMHPRKSITTGEGGMFTTNDKDIYDVAHAVRDFGFSVTNLERHKSGATIMPDVDLLGYNYRMCLPAGTKVLVSGKVKWRNKTNRGESMKLIPKAIETIRVGDEVLSFNEKTGKKEIKKVTGASILSDNDLVRLRFSNGNELVATSNHPLYIHNRGWVESGKVAIGDMAVQYMYPSLKWRICSLAKKGKTLEMLYGADKASSIKQIHGEKIHALRIDPLSAYNNSDTFLKAPMWNKRRKTIADLNQAGLLYSPERRAAIGLRSAAAWSADDSKLRDPEMLRRKGLSVSVSKRKRIQSDPEYAERCKAQGMRALRCVGRKPTCIENELLCLLRKELPDTYKYVGDGKFWIENINPDFINVNGYKKAIEVYAPYWKKRDYGSVEEYEITRRELLKKYGWDVLFIPAKRHIDNEKEIIKRVTDFTYNPNTTTVEVVSIEHIKGEHTVYNLAVEDNNNFFAYGILVHNTDIQAAIGVEQMKKYDWILKTKIHRAEIYNKEFAPLEWLQTPYIPPGYNHTYQSYAILLGDRYSNMTESYVAKWEEIRGRVMNKLKDDGIATRQGTHAVHMLGYYAKKYNLKPMDYMNTYAADKIALTIPLYPQMGDDAQQYVIDCIRSIKV